MIDDLGIDLEGMQIAVVSGYDHIVPLVVVQSSVTVAFNKVRAVTEVKDIMDVPERERREQRSVFTINSLTTAISTFPECRGWNITFGELQV